MASLLQKRKAMTTIPFSDPGDRASRSVTGSQNQPAPGSGNEPSPLPERGNPRAVRQAWPVIAALNFAPFCSVIVVWALVTREAALAMLVVANISLGCSCAGAALATFIARRRARRLALQVG